MLPYSLFPVQLLLFTSFTCSLLPYVHFQYNYYYLPRSLVRYYFTLFTFSVQLYPRLPLRYYSTIISNSLEYTVQQQVSQDTKISRDSFLASWSESPKDELVRNVNEKRGYTGPSIAPVHLLQLFSHIDTVNSSPELRPRVSEHRVRTIGSIVCELFVTN